MAESLSFDRVASIYDATRKLPTDVSGEITKALLDCIKAAGAERVLEIGVGTGRIARPLIAAGVPLTGVDISSEMMGRLRGQLPDGAEGPDLVLGDATRLPFRDESFGVVITVHVLHLVSSMAEALAEVRRVLRPGGVLLHQTRRPEDEEVERFWEETDRWWTEALAARGFERRKRPMPKDIRAYLETDGAHLSSRDVAREEYSRTMAEEYADIRGRVNSWTWEIPDDLIDALLPEFEEWMTERFGPPSASHTDRVVYLVETWRWD